MYGCNDKITLWRKILGVGGKGRDTFEREILPILCKVTSANASDNISNGRIIKPRLKIIVPFVKDFVPPKVGDYIACDERDFDITGEKPFDVASIEADLGEEFGEISRIKNNTRANLGKHWVIICGGDPGLKN